MSHCATPPLSIELSTNRFLSNAPLSNSQSSNLTLPTNLTLPNSDILSQFPSIYSFNKTTRLNTNLLGPKRVSEAFLDLIQKEGGRIVNVSSGSASMWLRNQPADQKKLFTSSDTTWEELYGAVKKAAPSSSGGYGLSKVSSANFSYDKK